MLCRTAMPTPPGLVGGTPAAAAMCGCKKLVTANPCALSSSTCLLLMVASSSHHPSGGAFAVQWVRRGSWHFTELMSASKVASLIFIAAAESQDIPWPQDRHPLHNKWAHSSRRVGTQFYFFWFEPICMQYASIQLLWPDNWASVSAKLRRGVCSTATALLSTSVQLC